MGLNTNRFLVITDRITAMRYPAVLVSTAGIPNLKLGACHLGGLKAEGPVPSQTIVEEPGFRPSSAVALAVQGYEQVVDVALRGSRHALAPEVFKTGF
ncbi:hypothetical protein ACIGO8_33220 [Streptomyces sp. NPDC053493]|uniref:hypothetical protein n=1 Tax=Streptomyces sp. NPDC053493 TaxID=3365705 RepID=UPI0037CCDD6B